MTINQEVIVQGIVLKNAPYKENDMLVWIYTLEYGKMALIARGVKKLKSKNAPSCQTLTLGEFTFIPRKGLSNLIKGTSLNYYRHLKSDIELEVYASYCIEFIYKYCQDNDPNETCFHTLKAALDCLEDGYQPKLVYLLYNAFILETTGSSLEVDQCVSCQRTDHIAGISIHGGGFICQECMGHYDRALDVLTLKGFRYINRCSFKQIDQLHLENRVIDELVLIMEKFVDEFTGLSFQSRKFITQFNCL